MHMWYNNDLVQRYLVMYIHVKKSTLITALMMVAVAWLGDFLGRIHLAPKIADERDKLTDMEFKVDYFLSIAQDEQAKLQYQLTTAEAQLADYENTIAQLRKKSGSSSGILAKLEQDIPSKKEAFATIKASYQRVSKQAEAAVDLAKGIKSKTKDAISTLDAMSKPFGGAFEEVIESESEEAAPALLRL